MLLLAIYTDSVIGHKSSVLETIKGTSSKTLLNEKTIQALKTSRQMKKPGPSIELGSMPKGKVLRTIKNYSGVNSSYGRDRTLVTKEGRCGKAPEPTSSLPEWFGPGYYLDVDKASSSQSQRPSSASHRLAFKSQGRQRAIDEKAAARKREIEQQLILRSAADAGESMMFGDEAFEDYHPSQSRSLTASCHSQPRYASSSTCSHGHMLMETSDMRNGENAWSRSSARSTIGRPVSQSGTRSPQDILFSPTTSSTREGLIFYDDLLSSEFMESSTSASLSQHSSNHSRSSRTNTASRSTNDMLSTNSVDSVLLKGVQRDKAKFKIPDYTMGALATQQSVSLIIPDPIEVTQTQEVSIANRFTASAKYGEADPRVKFAITSTDSGKYNQDLEKERARQSRRKQRNASKAAALLEDIRSDMLTERSSIVLDEDIPFTESMDSFVEKWRNERNLVSTKSHRPKSSGPRDLAPPVDFSQLLMDDSELGMTTEESQSLVSQYTSEFSKELDFL